MSVATINDLRHRLQRARVRRFVGRVAELEVFANRLQTAEPGAFSVLWVHGPGGIGKSSLLRAYADQARAAGCRVTELDGGRMHTDRRRHPVRARRPARARRGAR